MSTETQSYAPEVVADGSGTFAGNGLRFPTSKEAEEWVADLRVRWILVRETRVVESTEPANNRYENHVLVRIEEPA